MNPKSVEARNRDDKPFDGLIISNTDVLTTLKNRSSCSRCGKSRMYFCYTCFIAVPQLESQIPVCKLPIKIDIIKHKREIDGKSTAAHAAVLAPYDVNVYTYPDVPEYVNDGRTVLLYPGKDACFVSELFLGRCNGKTYEELLLQELPPGFNVGTLMTKTFNKDHNMKMIYHVENLPIDRIVLIDSTWNQSRGIFSDERLQSIPKIVLQNRMSQFWRHQKGSPRWYLSTIEALHQVLLELHLNAWGCSEDYNTDVTLNYPKHSKECQKNCIPYEGQYDNLLYFFKYMYEKLHSLYKHEDMLAYKRPMT